MTYAAVAATGQSNGGTGDPGPASVTTHNVGNFLLATIWLQQSGHTVTGLSATNITWTPLTPGFSGVNNSGWYVRTFIGVVTAVSTANTSITWTGGLPTAFSDFVMEEFSSTTGTPVLDNTAHLDGTGGTAQWPNIAAAGSGELYWGSTQDSGAASAGSTSGYVYNANADGNSNGTAYNLSVGPGTVTGPNWGDAGHDFGEMILVKPAAASAVTGSPNDLKRLLTYPSYRSILLKQNIHAPALQNQLLAYNGLGGTNGAVVANTDTGVGNTFDTVTLGTGGNAVYDNTHGSAQNCQSILFTIGSTSAQALCRWTPSFVDTEQVWWSVYCYFTSYPATTFGFILGRHTADAQNCGQWRINSTGHVLLSDATTTAQATSASVIPLNQAFRIEGRMLMSGGVGGLMEVRIYPDDNPASTPTEVLNVGGILTAQTGGSGDEATMSGIRFGFTAATTANISFNMWGMQSSNVAYPNPLSGAGGPTSATITLADTGAGVDTFVASGSLALADSGTGTDSFVTNASIVLADTGAGADSIVDSASLVLADPGTGTDSIVVGATIGLTDTGGGTDTVSDSAAVTLPVQAGSGLDAIVVSVTSALADSGIGADSVAVTVSPISLTDTGTGTDVLTVSVSATITDPGTGADAIVVAVTAALNDSGIGTDSIQTTSGITKTLTDTGTGADVLIVNATVPLSDTGVGSDSLVNSISLTLTDNGTAIESIAVSAAIGLTDTGTGSDAIVAAITALLADSGVGTDTINVVTGVTPKTLTDSGTGIDSLVTTAIVYLTDMGEGIDGVVQYVRLLEQGQGNDSILVAVSVSLADSGQGSDTLQAWPVSIISLSDAGSGTDSLVALPDNTNTVTLTDTGVGVDTLSLSQVISLSDAGQGADTIHVDAQVWLGYDDPVAEGHEPFDPFAPELARMAADVEESRPYTTRSGMTVLPNTWRMTPEEFLAHMRRMHSGRDPRHHSLEHAKGEGGSTRHIHR